MLKNFMLWQTDTFKRVDEKCLRVIASCKTPEQLKVALSYVALAEKKLKPLATTQEELDFLTNFRGFRNGFIMGILWLMKGRNDNISLDKTN